MKRAPPTPLLLLLLLLPLLPLAPTAQAQVLVYEVDAQAGYWYAVRIPSDWAGARAYHSVYGSLDAYRWDLNSSYVLFYTPASGKVYVYRSSVSSPLLNTGSWFNTTATVSFNSTLQPHGTAKSYTTARSWSLAPARAWRNATHVIVETALANVTAGIAVSLWYAPDDVNVPPTTTPTVNITLSIASGQNTTLHAVQSHSVSDFTVVYGSYSYSGYIVVGEDFDPNTYTVRAQQVLSVAQSVSGNTVAVSVYCGASGVSSPSGWEQRYTHSVTLTVSVSRSYPLSNSTLTADNGNRVVVVDSPAPSNANVREVSVLVYAYELSVSSNATWLVMSFNASPVNAAVPSVNPALYYNGRVYAGYYAVWSGSYVLAFRVGEAVSGTAYALWSFPRQVAVSAQFTPVNGSLSDYFAFTGTAQYSPDLRAYYVNGTMHPLAQQRLLLLDIRSGWVSGGVYRSNNLTLIHTDSALTADAVIGETVTELAVPVPVDVSTPAYANYTVVSTGWLAVPITEIVLPIGISGSWGYRIPVYVSLASQPLGSPVFRLELPLGVWVRQGLLSPGLEDLAITDAEGYPVYFYVSHWESADTAVVYARYAKPLPPGASTLALYVLLYNRALWNTGSALSRIQAFDFVKPETPFPTYGLYNALCIRPLPQWVRLYTSTADHATYYLNGTLAECHGGVCRSYQVAPILGGQELYIRIDGSVVNIFVDGEPALAIDVSTLPLYREVQGDKRVWWVEYPAAEFSAHFHSVPHAYSLGYLQGGAMHAPQQVQAERPASGGAGLDWGQLAMTMIPLVVVAIVLRIIQHPPTPSGGQQPEGGGLPWRR